MTDGGGRGAAVEAGIVVVHRDAHVLVVDKPHGLLSVPGRGPEHQDSVASRVIAAHPGARIVHRLDQVTSGLLVFALDAATHRELSKAFADRAVEKRYEAIVEGEMAGESGDIDLPLGADWPNRPRQRIDHANGKPSQTRWRVLAREVSGSLANTRLALEPLTGRTHQLRVHLAECGHPIVGDAFYGAAPAARVCLHAVRLGFRHPVTGCMVACESAAPF